MPQNDTGPSDSFLSRMFKPLSDAPSKVARQVTKKLDSKPTENPTLAKLKGFGLGALEGAGDVASDFTSPASLLSILVPELSPIKRFKGLMGSAEPLIQGAQVNPVNVTPQFNTAEEAVSHYLNKTIPRRGAPGDVPNNPTAQALEAERRLAEQNYRKR